MGQSHSNQNQQQMMLFSKQDRYEGGLFDNIRQGQGTYIYKNGDRYEGCLNNDQKEGKGKMYYRDGDLYIGDWKNDQKEGKGKMYYNEGGLYIGDWKNDQKHGQGKQIKDGESYNGEWKDGLKEGKGEFRCKDGSVYIYTYHKGDLIGKKKATEKDLQQMKKILRRNTSTDQMMMINDIGVQGQSNGSLDISDKMMNSQEQNYKTLDVGPETLNMLECYVDNKDVFVIQKNKNIKDYSIQDIGDWLVSIGLQDYVQVFQENHINGSNIFEIVEKELKEEFGMLIYGDRKFFLKKQQEMKQLQNQQVREKIKNVLDSNKKLKSQRQNDKGANNPQSLKEGFGSLYMTKLDDVIEEEVNSKSESSDDQVKHFKEDEFLFNQKTLGDMSQSISNSSSKKKRMSARKSREKNQDVEVSVKSIGKEYVTIGKRVFINQFSVGNEDQNDAFMSQQMMMQQNADLEQKLKKNKQLNGNQYLFSNSYTSSDEESQSESSCSSNDRNKQTSNDEKNQQKMKFKKMNMKKQHNKNKKIQQQKQIVKKVGIANNFTIDIKELEFIKKVGEGAFGEVYLGVWFGQEVAIKQYGKKISNKKMKKSADFIVEVDIISSLRHPNIVLYMGVCMNYSHYLMVTEFLDGGSLFDLLHKKNVKIKDDQLICVCEDIALGMNYLHGRRVLHCDLKSSNILIDANWNLKLCDFGLSRVKSKLDNKKGLVGTPHWMAPEILRGERYDESSDVYSYGMVLWEMITQKIPYYGLSIVQIIGSVGFDESYEVEIPDEGIPLILKIIRICLNRDRTKRPSFCKIVEMLHVSNRTKEKKRYIIKELQRFFG